jgi:dTDP-4-dehydrorhamnose 3,5-epimerase
MQFTETDLAGAFIIDLDRREDERGFFAREFCREEFAARGLNLTCVQSNLCSTARAGTLRGMHFQFPPAAETKLVRCLRGAILDVIVDLRPESPTYLDHYAVELSEDNWRALYVPERFAHGYQTLTDHTVTSYHMGKLYTPSAEGGLRHDDPALAIAWPMPVSAISERDRSFEPYARSAVQIKTRMSIRDHLAVPAE